MCSENIRASVNYWLTAQIYIYIVLLARIQYIYLYIYILHTSKLHVTFFQWQPQVSCLVLMSHISVVKAALFPLMTYKCDANPFIFLTAGIQWLRHWLQFDDMIRKFGPKSMIYLHISSYGRLTAWKTAHTQVWLLGDSCQLLDLNNFQNSRTWCNSTLLIKVWIIVEWLTIWRKDCIQLALGLKNFPLISILSLYLLVSSVICHKCQLRSHPVAVSLAPGMLRDFIVIVAASFWLQWKLADGTLTVLKCMGIAPTQRGIENWQMYAMKQIMACVEYRDMLPRPRLNLTGTPGHRLVGLRSRSRQTSLGLGSMSRYSAEILMCILRKLYA